MDTNLDPNQLLNVDPALVETVQAKVQEHSSGIADAVADGPGSDMLESLMDGAGDAISGAVEGVGEAVGSLLEGAGSAIGDVLGSLFD